MKGSTRIHRSARSLGNRGVLPQSPYLLWGSRLQTFWNFVLASLINSVKSLMQSDVKNEKTASKFDAHALEEA
jgi:hypothetical protein